MKPIIYSVIALAILSSCKDDDSDGPLVPTETEVITSLTYTLTDSDTGAEAIFQYTDPDGPNGNAPVVTADTLQANQTYSGSISLLNQLDDPVLNFTEEISENGTEYQFFYTPSLDSLAVTYSDSDEDGNPIGITTHLMTNDAGSGTLTITLRQDPNKTAAGVAEGNITNAVGETVIEVVFNLVVE